MKRLSIITFCFFLVLCICACKDSQKEANTLKTQTSDNKSLPKYLNTPFDMSTEKISVPFSGHDIEQLYNAFDKGKKSEKKDEFETTEQFQKRLSTQRPEPLWGSVRPNSIFAFVINPRSEYDADNQTLTILIETSDVWQSSQIDKDRIALKFKDVTSTFGKKYIGQNAFGAKIEIEKCNLKSFELAIHNQHNFETEKVFSESEKKSQKEMAEFYEKHNLIGARPSPSGGKTVIVIKLTMTPSEAKVAKEMIAALCLARPTIPNISYYAIMYEATLEYPSDLLNQKYYVDVDLLEIWIFNRQTGEIIAKSKGTKPKKPDDNLERSRQEINQLKAEDVEFKDQKAPAPPTIPDAQKSQEPKEITWAPSFDCTKVSNGAERLICSNKVLSEADVYLSQIYHAALKSSQNKEVLRREQNAWRKNERDACADVLCMAKAYQQRISQLLR